MRKFVVLIKFQAIAVTSAATSILSLSAVLGLPALAQEAESDTQEASVEVVTPAAEEAEAEPLDPLTADNPDIPTNQLEIMLKPLPQEQVQAEADAWYGLLQEKAQEISDLELSIEQQTAEIDGAVDSEKEKNVVAVTELKTEQTTLVSRLGTVVDDLEAKGGDPAIYRQYSDAINGIEFNITNTEGLGLRFTTWLQSEEGGIRWGLNLLKFGGILVAASVIAPRAGKITDKALVRVDNISNLFRGFIVMVVKRGVLVVGGLLALASVGVNLGPILAVVGGASFVLAFALQSNLGNFASGLMLLVNKPFDVGDEVKVAGYWAYVDSISLASTKLKDFSGNIVTLPNNTVWGGDIINMTHSDFRKVKMNINAKFSQDVGQVSEIWTDITNAHPKVLKDRGASIFPWSSSYDYKIGIGLNAWTKTEDYWSVYRDLLQALQQALETRNIELAAPIQEIKFEESAAGEVVAQLSGSNQSHPVTGAVVG
ncbi:MAG: mechanosensitive ion channel family protein [Cyanobacteria bacterium P01_B01_bin.77]